MNFFPDKGHQTFSKNISQNHNKKLSSSSFFLSQHKRENKSFILSTHSGLPASSFSTTLSDTTSLSINIFLNVETFLSTSSGEYLKNESKVEKFTMYRENISNLHTLKQVLKLRGFGWFAQLVAHRAVNCWVLRLSH